MIGKPRPGRYSLHGLDSPEGEAVLAEQGLTRADLESALAELERTEGIGIRTIVGINDDAMFGSTREGWRPDLPDACREPFVPLALDQGPGVAGPRAPGQHRAIYRGRHAA